MTHGNVQQADKMGRSKPKEFRYQRINFDDDDDEDNSDLARALGPSPGAQRATCAQCVRGFCIVSTILATTAFIATAALFGSVILPSGTKIFGNTTDLLNHDGNITIGVNDTQVEATQHLNETTTNTTSAEPNLEQNSSMMNETQLETNSTKNPPSENQAQEPSTPTNDHSEDDNDDSSDTDKTDQSEDNDKTHPNSTLTAKADSDSETKVTSRKLLSLSSTEKSENVTTTETVEAPDQASSFQALLVSCIIS